jgi:putative ABC transport system permease protein
VSATSSARRWRFAAGLARREVRRRPGRTALVMLLIAVPVVGMTVASVLFRTDQADHTNAFRREYGQADLAVEQIYPTYDERTGGLVQGSIEEQVAVMVAALPDDSEFLRYERGFGFPVVVGDALTYAEVSNLTLDDPMTAGIYEVLEGRLPAADDEVIVSPDVAADLDVKVGDRVEFVRPEATLDVVGIARSAAQWNTSLLVGPGLDLQAGLTTGNAYVSMLVDLPAGVVPSRFADQLPDLVWNALPNAGLGEIAAADGPSETERLNSGGSVQAVVWGWVAGALGLAVFGIIVTAAFATSARRQLVTIGQLSANGAEEPLIRRTLALQGAWSALLGSILGVVVGVALVVACRGTVEALVDHRVLRFVVSWGDLVVIVLTAVVVGTGAALVPARSASRTSTLSALAGRRPLGAVPPRLVPTGVALFGAGTAILGFVGFSSRSGSDSADLIAAVAVVAGLMVLAGACCLSPVVIGALGPLAERIGGAPRLVARSLARTRTRSAAVVAAITTTAAFVLGGSMAWGSADRSDAVGYLPNDVVLVRSWQSQEPTAELQAIVEREIADAQSTVDEVVSTGRWVPMREVVIVADAEYPAQGFIADEPLLDLLGVSARDRQTFADEGLLLLNSGYSTTDETVSLAAFAPGVAADLMVDVAKDPAAYGWWGTATLVSEERAESLGWAVRTFGAFARTAAPLTEEQSDALSTATYGGLSYDPWSVVPPESTNAGAGIEWNQYDPNRTDWFVPVLALLGFALILLVVGIGLALSATESRDERDVLVAIGAPPRTMRSVAALKAVGLAAAGCLMAVPTGLIPVAVVWDAGTAEGRAAIPWLALALVVAVTPLFVGALAWVASVAAQIVRPVRMSTLAAD